MYKIWFESTVPDDYRNMFEDVAEGICPGEQVKTDPYHRLDEAHGVIAGGRAFDGAALDRAPNLLIIARTGVGYDTLDVDAASARGIACVNAPEAPTVSTAELAVTLMMTVARAVKRIENELNRMIESGERRSLAREYVALEMQNTQFGIIGLGRIGGHVSGIAKAIGMRVVAYDPYIDDGRFAKLGVQRANSIDELLAGSDFVSLHLPLNDETYKLMNAERFAQMKAGAVFINVARGGHVDEAALTAALDSGHLFGAGLDVTDPEPPLPGNPLLGRDNVVITPHIASSTVAGRPRLTIHALEQVLQALRGERPPHLLNPAVWDTARARWEAIQG